MRVLFAGQPIPKSPFEVDVDKALGDATKVTAKGPGIEPVGNVANKPTYFEIYTAGQRSRPLKWTAKDFSMRWNVERPQSKHTSPHKSGTLASKSGRDPVSKSGKTASVLKKKKTLSLSMMEVIVYTAAFSLMFA